MRPILSIFRAVTAILWMLENSDILWFDASFRYEPRSEKTGLRGFRPGPTQTRLYSYKGWLEA